MPPMSSERSLKQATSINREAMTMHAVETNHLPALIPQPAENSAAAASNSFSDRRAPRTENRVGGPERRQFTTTPSSMRPEVAEFAEAVDRYKMEHRRRFITFEELFNVMTSLGYHK